jgi:hypothetical protein
MDKQPSHKAVLQRIAALEAELPLLNLSAFFQASIPPPKATAFW